KNSKSSKNSENKNSHNRPHKKLRKEVASPPGCFRCGKTGHNKVNYPQKDRERVFHAAWGSDNESNTSDGDEEMFMAIADLSDDEVQATASSEEIVEDDFDLIQLVDVDKSKSSYTETAPTNACESSTINAQPPQYISKRHPATQTQGKNDESNKESAY
ncbi:hypothetical protein LINGRAHAP2_LOCUS24654, partial [Linum grandiflorum]